MQMQVLHITAMHLLSNSSFPTDATVVFTPKGGHEAPVEHGIGKSSVSKADSYMVSIKIKVIHSM